MADPLAITSGIAGLLSLGIQVTHSLVSFYIERMKIFFNLQLINVNWLKGINNAV